MTDSGERELYRNRDSRVVAWLERRIAEPPALYVKIERCRHVPRDPHGPSWAIPVEMWEHVKTWTDVRLEKQPWWKPWAWCRELQGVIGEAIEWCEEQADREQTAETTLQAVAEAMQAAAPLVARRS